MKTKFTVNDERFLNERGEEYLLEVGQRIRGLRKRKKITLIDLGDRVGLTYATLSRYENGQIGKVDISRIEDIANALGTTPAYILGYATSSLDLPPENVAHIPLYSKISCGYGMFVDDVVEDYIAIPDKMLMGYGDFYAMTAQGDSMTGKQIFNGDILVFEKVQNLNSGEIGCFCVDDYIATCKIFRKLPNDLIMLESANEKYDPIIVDNATSNFRIIGKLRFKLQQVQ